MIIGIKDEIKLIGISIIACCAVFVCTLFLNYNIDLATATDGVEVFLKRMKEEGCIE